MIKKRKAGRPKKRKENLVKKPKNKLNNIKPRENEEWRYIPETDDCYVSNEGRVKWIEKINLKSGVKKKERELIIRKNPQGYMRVTLKYPEDSAVPKNKRRELVHILVGRAFVNNPENKPIINHIDGVKDNNFVNINPDFDPRPTNIEWSTYSENNQHAYNTGLNHHGSRKHNTFIIAVDRTTREAKLFDSKDECAKSLGINISVINQHLHNRCLLTKGYFLGYLTDDNITKKSRYMLNDMILEWQKKIKNCYKV